MKNRRLSLVLVTLAIILLANASFDGELIASEPVVRTQTDPEIAEDVVVGQRVRLILDVLDQDGWANVPSLPSLNVPGAIVYTPSGQATRLNESIKGNAYTGQRNEWWIYPQRGGAILIPVIELNVEVKTFGAKTERELIVMSTKPIEMAASVPEGALVSNGLVATDRFQVKQTWDPSRTTISVGDGVVRRIERKINGSPALVIPELAIAEVTGVEIYRKVPESQESSSRGELTSIRVDQATYVFAEPGTFELSTIQFQWWDSKKSRLETEILFGETIVVLGASESSGPKSDSPEQASAGAKKLGAPWRWVAVIAICVILAWLWLKGWKSSGFGNTLRNSSRTDPLPPLNP